MNAKPHQIPAPVALYVEIPKDAISRTRMSNMRTH